MNNNDPERIAALEAFERQRAVKQARAGDFDPLRQMVEACDFTQEDRAEQLKSLDTLASLRARLDRKVEIRLERTVQDVVTAECRVCKQRKEGVVFTDRRAGRVAFQDVFVCWDDFVMVTKKTKEMGLFEPKLVASVLVE